MLTGCSGLSSSADSLINESEERSSAIYSEENSAALTTPPQTSAVSSSSTDTTLMTEDTTSLITSQPSETVTLTQSQQTTTTEATTTPPTTTTPPPETTTSATTSPPVVVIPQVKVPSSPGVETYSNQFATIDVSNKSEGYFTAKYTGSSKDVKMQVSKDGKKYAYNINTSGKTEVIPLQMGSGEYSIFIGELVSGTSYAAVLNEKISVSISNSNSVYLYPSQQVNFNQNSKIVTKSAELCAGKSSDLEKIGAIFTYITSNISYDYNFASQVLSGAVTVYLPDPDRTLSTNIGICYDYSAIFAAMCRAQGIPTRMVQGYVGAKNLFHAWNEVYTPQTGWITADIKLGKQGFNPLDATFYAGASDKSSVVSKFTDTSYYKATYYF